MTCSILAALLLSPLELDLPNGSDPPPAPTITVKTFYEGMVTYKLHPTGCYVRSGPKADERVKYNKAFSEKDSSFGPFKRTREVIALQAAIQVRVKRDAAPEEIWEAARSILKWMRKHARFDPDKYDVLIRAGRKPTKGSLPRDWPSIEQIASYYAEHGELPYSACFSEAHLVFQLFRICGLPTEDFGIASSRWQKDEEGKQMREHVYIGLRVGGDWFYIDPGARLPPPYAKRASVGRKMGEGPGCDYAHPTLFKVVAGARFQAIPLLVPRRAPE